MSQPPLSYEEFLLTFYKDEVPFTCTPAQPITVEEHETPWPVLDKITLRPTSEATDDA